MFNIFFKLKRKLKNYCFYRFNKYRFNLIKTTFNYRPYDYGYMLDVLKQMAIYNQWFYNSDHAYSTRAPIVARDMKLMESLIAIVNSDRDLFSYVNHEYICNVYVNRKNIDRYIYNESFKKYCYSHPDELYRIKAIHLISKLIKYRLDYWSD